MNKSISTLVLIIGLVIPLGASGEYILVNSKRLSEVLNAHERRIKFLEEILYAKNGILPTDKNNSIVIGDKYKESFKPNIFIDTEVREIK